jgi:hypothetical protein
MSGAAKDLFLIVPGSRGSIKTWLCWILRYSVLPFYFNRRRHCTGIVAQEGITNPKRQDGFAC